MTRSYDSYYSGKSYDELYDGNRNYDSLASGSGASLEFDYGDAYCAGYRRERDEYRPRASYDSYYALQGYRSAEAARGYDRNYARDNVVLRARQEKPKTLGKAAGRP
jgi:hypothetical protein